jgi:hypothetical protein
VIGCLGIAILASIGFLVFVAIVILERLGNGMGEPGGRGRASSELRPGPVIATSMAEERKRIQLSGPVDAVERAGGGRFLLLRVPREKHLYVFDPNSAGIRHISLEEPSALFAGSAAKLFIYYPKARRIERWNLVSLEHEESATQPRNAPTPVAMSIGTGVDGPLFLFSRHGGSTSVTAVETQTLEPSPAHQIDGMQMTVPVHIRPSAHGTVLGVSSESGALVLKYQNGRFQAEPLKAGAKPPQVATPSPDGRYMYTPRGVFTVAVEPSWVLGQGSDFYYTFPAAQGNTLYLSLEVNDRARVEGPCRLHDIGSISLDTLATLDDPRIQGAEGWMSAGEISDVTADQRVHLWPAAGLIAFLPRIPGSTIELTKVDVEEILKGYRKDYIVFGSDPPASAVVGQEWSYKPDVWTRRPKKLSVELDVGPPGMKMRDGELSWKPSKKDRGAYDVRIRADDTLTKGVAEQVFRLVVVGETE